LSLVGSRIQVAPLLQPIPKDTVSIHQSSKGEIEVVVIEIVVLFEKQSTNVSFRQIFNCLSKSLFFPQAFFRNDDYNLLMKTKKCFKKKVQ
jgi:hypothetical protein